MSRRSFPKSRTRTLSRSQRAATMRRYAADAQALSAGAAGPWAIWWTRPDHDDMIVRDRLHESVVEANMEMFRLTRCEGHDFYLTWRCDNCGAHNHPADETCKACDCAWCGGPHRSDPDEATHIDQWYESMGGDTESMWSEHIQHGH